MYSTSSIIDEYDDRHDDGGGDAVPIASRGDVGMFSEEIFGRVERESS